jgi:hypothetical protein
MRAQGDKIDDLQMASLKQRSSISPSASHKTRGGPGYANDYTDLRDDGTDDKKEANIRIKMKSGKNK